MSDSKGERADVGLPWVSRSCWDGFVDFSGRATLRFGWTTTFLVYTVGFIDFSTISLFVPYEKAKSINMSISSLLRKWPQNKCI